MANQELTFDITKLDTQQEKQQYIVSRVGDGGLKAITISVTSNGTPYNITDLEPIFEGIKPDGEHIIDTTGGTVLDPKNGVFRYIFPQQASTAEGDYQQAFFKLKRGEQTDSTIEVDVKVLKNKVEFGINSESYFTEYQKELERLRTTVESGLRELNSTSENTKTKIQSQLETANMLDVQIKALKSSMESKELVTKFELNNQINQLTEQVSDFATSLQNSKQNTEQKIKELVSDKLDGSISGEAIVNPANINKSGFYYFNSTTQNMPVRNSNNADGYIQAIMKDENNGMLTILGTGLSIEKYKGQLYQRWRSSQPILLWRGSAKKDTTIELKDSVHNYLNLIINVSFYTDSNATKFVTVPNNGQKVYLNQIGLRLTNGNLKNGYLEEIGILIKDDTHLTITKTQIATDNEPAVDSTATITAIYGIY